MFWPRLLFFWSAYSTILTRMSSTSSSQPIDYYRNRLEKATFFERVWVPLIDRPHGMILISHEQLIGISLSKQKRLKICTKGTECRDVGIFVEPSVHVGLFWVATFDPSRLRHHDVYKYWPFFHFFTCFRQLIYFYLLSLIYIYH